MIALKNILVPTDFGEAAEAALTYGRALAERFGSSLHVLHVTQPIYLNAIGMESPTAFSPDLPRDIENAARQHLDALLTDSDNSGPPTTSSVLTSGSPALAIINYANDHGVDLIVMGTHGRGALAHIIMGSVAERVVRLASCPVLTVRHPEREFVRPDTLVPVAETHV